MRFIVFLIICFIPQFTYSANRIHYQDFESTGWEDDFRPGAWSGKMARVTNNPHGGSYSLRGNLMEAGGNDPITGLLGEGNPQLEFAPTGVIVGETSEVFVRYWRRFDACTWSGTLGGYGKGEYITDDVDGVTAYYTRMAQHSTDYRVYGNGAYSQSEETANWGALYADLQGSDPGGADGQWHKFEIYADYRDANNKYIKMWVDDVLLTARSVSVGYVIDGKIIVDDTFLMRGLQLLYVDNAQVSTSTDGAGYAVGYQFDDIEVWDGMPDTEEATHATLLMQ